MKAGRLRAGEPDRADETVQASGDTGTRARPRRGTAVEPEGLVAKKQVHRWVNDGGALLPHD